jgi:hypothetical protein
MFFNRIGISGLLLCLVSPAGVALSETITASEYLPLEDGNSWTYRVTEPNDTYFRTDTVLPGTTLINNVATKAVRDTDGDIAYLTSDENGIKLYRWYFTFDGETVNFNPPVVIAPGTFEIPSQVSGSGTVEFTVAGLGTAILNYTYSNRFVSKETITVPADTYETIRSETTFRFFGDAFGQPLNETLTSTSWYARYIGQVKATESDSEGTLEAVLTSTNVRPPLLNQSLPWLSPLLLP